MGNSSLAVMLYDNLFFGMATAKAVHIWNKYWLEIGHHTFLYHPLRQKTRDWVFIWQTDEILVVLHFFAFDR